MAPELLVSTALGGAGKLGGVARVGAQGLASGLTDGASNLQAARLANGNGLVTQGELDIARRSAESGAVLATVANGMTRNAGPVRNMAGQAAVGSLNGGAQQFYKNINNDVEPGRDMDTAMIGGGFSAVGNPFGVRVGLKPRSFRY